MKTAIAILMLAAAVALVPCSATTIIACSRGATISDVTAIDGCYLGPYTFQDFAVSHSTDFMSALAGISAAEMIGPSATLTFLVTTDPQTINRQPESTWVNLSYVASTSSWPMDFADLQLTAGSGVIVFETVCASDPAQNFSVCPANDVLARLDSWGQYTSASFSRSVTVAYIDKFITFDDASLQTFQNGIGANPEPATWVLVVPTLLVLLLAWKVIQHSIRNGRR